jgi:hypothetical protein
MKKIILAIAITFGSLVSFTGNACGLPDSTTHVGKLMSIDKQEKQFTILDMMLGVPVSFIADARILSDLEGAKGTIQVDFEKQSDQLKAVAVRH